VTDLLRTLCDLGTKVPFHRLRICVERAISNFELTVDDIVRRRFELARRGRDGVGPLRLLLAEWAPDLAAVESALEEQLVAIAERYGLPRLTRQHEVVLAGETFRLDLSYPRLKIAIEGDGFGVHSTRRMFERDRARQNLLVLDGWLILRFTWQQVVRHPEQVAGIIRQAIASRR
jgi:very-short-patch-repair endonuclease